MPLLPKALQRRLTPGAMGLRHATESSTPAGIPAWSVALSANNQCLARNGRETQRQTAVVDFADSLPTDDLGHAAATHVPGCDSLDRAEVQVKADRFATEVERCHRISRLLRQPKHQKTDAALVRLRNGEQLRLGQPILLAGGEHPLQLRGKRIGVLELIGQG